MAAVVLFTTVSCGDFLNVKPKGKVIPESDEEYLAVMSNMLYAIETCESTTGSAIFPGPEEVLDFEAISDNLDANLEDIFGEVKSGLPLYEGSQINKRQSYWTSLFKNIRDCNIIMDEMSTRDSELSKEMMAACLAIKGVCYYHLMRNFCKPYSPATAGTELGIPIVETFDIENYPQRSSLQATAAYVVDLLNASAGYHVTDGKFLFTEELCKVFLAKTYFWTQDWAAAESLCRELLKKHPLSERASYSKMIQDERLVSGEILSRSFSKGSTVSLTYTDAKKAAGRRPVNKTLIDLFAEDLDKDIRYTTFVGNRRMNAKTLGYRLRSSELCLMLAECLVHEGKQAEALDQLNLLRSKRIEDCIPYTMESLPEVGSRLIQVDAEGKSLTPLMSAIFDERRKEFFLEGDRWYELKRNGMPEMVVISNARKYTTKEYLYTFPINRKDVDLGGLKQNEGYRH